MRALYAFARAYPWRTAAVLLALIVAGTVEGASLTALLPLIGAAAGGGAMRSADAKDDVSRRVLEAVEATGLTPSFGVLIALVVAGLSARSLIALLAKRHVGYTVARVATDLRLALLRSLLAARWEYFTRQPVGTLANAMSVEAERASRAYVQGATMAATVIQLAVYSVVAVWVSWQATVVSLASATLLGFALRGLIRRARRAGSRQTKLMRSLIRDMTDALQSVKSLKSMAREGTADLLLATQAEGLNKAMRREVLSKEALKAAQQPVFSTLVGIGGYLGIVQWQMPVATVMVLLVLLVRLLASVGKVQSQYQDVVSCEAAFWALRRTIREAEAQVEPVSGTQPPTLEREICLQGVHFAYDEMPVLRDFSMQIPAGSLTALVGFSGAGKTTVLDLVIGLLRPRDGEVRVDGVPLEQFDMRAWRRMIGYVPQENVLLHDSVLHNVTLGDPALDAAAAERALRAAGAWSFVSALPEGIYSNVGERGGTLSGGQRQRVLIARALAHEPRLLILDEATSALDPETEAAVWETLRGLRGRMTLLAISHRPVLVEQADRVYRLEKGQAILVVPEPAASPATVG